ncbi:MAG TPA: HAD family hydrolase [Actinomycetota bacterium]|nr:HAD family hydrolase [Actinomycetota bacterium]
MTIRAVTFDCWGTLLAEPDVAASTAARVRAIAEAADGDLSPEQAQELLDAAWREHHLEWLGGRQYGSPGIARYVAQELGNDAVIGLLQEAFEDAGRHGTTGAVAGARDTLIRLRERGIRTALVCDAGMTPGRVVRDLLSNVGLLEHLEFCAFSDEIGVPKPSAKMFEAALTAIVVEPHEAVHVGDLLRTDVDGGRAYGMKTIRITAVNDDVRQGFSWDESAVRERRDTTEEAPFHDADEVIASYDEFEDALKRLEAAP